MPALKTLDHVRRKFMRCLTQHVGHSFGEQIFDGKKAVKRILVCRPNHRLGNLLLVTPLVQELQNLFPEAKIDLFVKGALAMEVFKNYDNVDQIIQLPKKPFKELVEYIKGWLKLKRCRYDIVINVDKSSSSGRLSTRFATSTYKFFGDLPDTITRNDNHKHLAKYPVYILRGHLFDGKNNDAAIPTLNLMLSQSEIERGKLILDRLIDPDKKTICLFTYATGSKCYSEAWWSRFYEQLKNKYPDYNILEILPIENISKISFRAATFYSRDVREIGAVIANTDAFIGADSGIMHLASAVQTLTIGLFSVTDQNKYLPYNGKSKALNTNEVSTKKCVEILDTILRPSAYTVQETVA